MKHRLIDPKTLAAIKDLPLVAKTVVEGFMAGLNLSIKRGAGMEFSQYRSYQPGDDLRQLDWKMFARSDRYYIRESEVETSITVRFVVDASASMAHTDSNGISKAEYAKFLVASLAYLAAQQGDAVGLYVLYEKNLINLTPKRDTMHLQRLWHTLDQIKPSGYFAEQTLADNLLAETRGKEMTVFVSDMYEQEEEITRLLFRLSARKNEVLLFHLMGKNELEFSYSGNLHLEDLETGQVMQVNASQQRQQYLAKLDQWMKGLQEKLLRQQIVYEHFTLHQPLDQALRAFLQSRNKGS
jgi:uncharacterized protein (DUF58 family)